MARIALEIEDDLREEASQLAKKEDRSLSSLIRVAIKEYLANHANGKTGASSE